jgi:hypothetical protein
MRVKSEIWVRAYLRRCQAEGIPAVVARRGDEAAGAIFICVDHLDGTVTLYGPAPAGVEGSETERRWVSCLSSGSASNAEASAYLARQSRFDSDLWVIEIEDKHGRNFLGDDAIEE